MRLAGVGVRLRVWAMDRRTLGRHRAGRWTTSELLSGLRSIEWDLQDLEDTVSIVKGNRLKFQLDDADVQARPLMTTLLTKDYLLLVLTTYYSY